MMTNSKHGAMKRGLAYWIATVAFCGAAFDPITNAVADGPSVDLVIRPNAAPGPLDNPLKGWCPYVDAGPIRQPYSMVFLYAPWIDLEPVEGKFAFDRWERRSWSTEKAKGKHVVFRVYIDYPSRPSGLPEWLRARGVKESRYVEHGGGLSPDYTDERLVSAVERFIAALGRRYDSDPRVAFIELGLLGFWGEWHTWPQSRLYAGPQVERRVLDAYRRAFPHKLLQARAARDDAGRRAWLGFHDDMFPQDTDNGEAWSFLTGMRTTGRVDNWKRAPMGGEMVPHEAKIWLGPKYRHTVEMIERSRFTWVGPYCPALEDSGSREFTANCERLVRRMGYQFQIKEVKHPSSLRSGESFRISVEGVNEGVAPFYYRWPVVLGLISSSGRVVASKELGCDVRDWLPGNFHIQEDLQLDAPAGRYRLGLGILDPWSKRAAVGFANDLEQVDGWTVLSNVIVVDKK